jgi:hypothetical protein
LERVTMSKVKLQYVGPELREFGGKIGDEKFVVKAAKVVSESTITNDAGDTAKVEEYGPRFVNVSERAAATLLSLTLPASKAEKGSPMYVKVEGEADESSDADSRVEKAEGTDARMNAEPSTPATGLGSFSDVSGRPSETVEDKATPHVYGSKRKG